MRLELVGGPLDGDHFMWDVSYGDLICLRVPSVQVRALEEVHEFATARCHRVEYRQRGNKAYFEGWR